MATVIALIKLSAMSPGLLAAGEVAREEWKASGLGAVLKPNRHRHRHRRESGRENETNLNLSTSQKKKKKTQNPFFSSSSRPNRPVPRPPFRHGLRGGRRGPGSRLRRPALEEGPLPPGTPRRRGARRGRPVGRRRAPGARAAADRETGRDALVLRLRRLLALRRGSAGPVPLGPGRVFRRRK